MPTDAEIEAEIGLSREDHENRNIYNELPKGKINPSPDDPTVWLDEDSRPWKLNKEQNAAYHQPMPVPVAFIRALLSKTIPWFKVPNLKFISPNADGRYSEIIANRYTGELVIEQKILGTFNLCTDAPDGMIGMYLKEFSHHFFHTNNLNGFLFIFIFLSDGNLPTDGEHRQWDILPHEQYGWNYRHIAKGIEIGSIEKGPVVLGTLDTK